MNDCYHCGLSIPPGSNYQVDIQGQIRAMCCPGCVAAARMIVGSGLSGFYHYRTRPAPPGTEEKTEDFTQWDHPEEQKQFIEFEADTATAIFIVSGVRCAACSWLIESFLNKYPGVLKASFNVSTQRLRIQWNVQKTPVSELMTQVWQLGYTLVPFQPNEQQKLQQQEHQTALKRLLVSGLGMMQVMMYAVGLYAGALQGIEAQYKVFLQWASFGIALVVLLYAGQPFFLNAWRALKTRHLTMDVPVALALGLIFTASTYAVLSRQGEVYFDSICMFIFFLTLARFIEFRIRQKACDLSYNLVKLQPLTTWRLSDAQRVSIQQLKLGDLICVNPGETIPVDGRVVYGASSVSSAHLTGESKAQTLKVGHSVLAGSVNLTHVLHIEVTQVGQATRLAKILFLLEQAQTEKPFISKYLDKIARYFIAAVLAISFIVYWSWYFIDPTQALWACVAVLVATCPCALSLATPVAITATCNHLATRGFLITRAHVLNHLDTVALVIFDKTGTLTEGRYHILEADIRQEQALCIMQNLEAHSNHPISSAFPFTPECPKLKVEDFTVIPGSGIEGTIEGKRYRAGKPKNATGMNTQVALSEAGVLIAKFSLGDTLRQQAPSALASLKHMGIQTAILSGDNVETVNQINEILNADYHQGNLTPQDKLAFLQKHQKQDQPALAVGDGINDSPLLAHADISIATRSGTDLAKATADCILLDDNLDLIPAAIQSVKKMRRIIRQNLTWALAYNIGVLPLAALGVLPPYMAAIGMSLSSLVVVWNAARSKT